MTGFPIYLMSGQDKVALYHQILNGNAPLIIRISTPIKLLSGVVYAAATIVFLRRHREQVKASDSSVERVNLRWLLWLGATAGVIWLMAVVFQVAGISIPAARSIMDSLPVSPSVERSSWREPDGSRQSVTTP